MITGKNVQLAKMEEIIDHIENSSSDDGIMVRIDISDKGYTFSSNSLFTTSSLMASMRKAFNADGLVIEFVSSNPLDASLPTIIYFDKNGPVETVAQAIMNWFTLKDGHLFNVPENGGLHCYSVKRHDGMAYITSFMGD